MCVYVMCVGLFVCVYVCVCARVCVCVSALDDNKSERVKANEKEAALKVFYDNMLATIRKGMKPTLDRRFYMSQNTWGEEIENDVKIYTRRFWAKNTHNRFVECYGKGYTMLMGGWDASLAWHEVQLVQEPYYEVLGDMPLEHIRLEGDKTSKTLEDFITKGKASQFFQKKMIQVGGYTNLLKCEVSVVKFKSVRSL